MLKYKIPARFARFEDGEYVHYPAGATVELSEKEFARFAAKPEPVSGDGDVAVAAAISAETLSTTGEPLSIVTPDVVMPTPKNANKRGSNTDSGE